MMIEFLKKNKKFILETLLLLLGGIIINFACFLFGSIYSHAENIYYPVESGVNYPLGAFTTEQILEYCNNYSSLPSDYYYIIKIQDIGNNYYPAATQCDVFVFSKSIFVNDNMNTFPLYCEVTSNGSFQFHLNNLYNNDRLNIKIYHLLSYNGAPTVSSVGVSNMDGDSPLINPKYSYIFNVSVPKDFLTNTEYVLKYNESINVGDFVDLPGLDEILNNINNTWQPPSNITGHALPSQPTENPNNNDFQNRLQMFDYLKDSINAIVGNLGYNLKNWLDNLIGKMVEGFNSVSLNIWNGFKTLMDNIKDFFGPKIDTIIEKFNYITEPFDSQEFSSNLNNANFSSDFLGLITTVSSFGTALTSGSEPSSCSFTLDFSNSYYNFGVCEFSLDWILPFRSIIRLIVGCLCVYSLIISIFTSLNTYIGGTSSINDDI